MSERDAPSAGGTGWPVETTVPDGARPSDGAPEAAPEGAAEATAQVKLPGRPDTDDEDGAQEDGGQERASTDVGAVADAAGDAGEDPSSGPRTDRHAVQPDVAALERGAIAAAAAAYAPYSHFPVGAVVFGEGREFAGVNVENASFGLTICAERNAVAHAVASGVLKLSAVAVCTESPVPSSPCGSCRQVLAEFADDPRTFRVIAVNPRGERREWTLDQLLPDSFTRAELPGKK